MSTNTTALVECQFCGISGPTRKLHRGTGLTMCSTCRTVSDILADLGMPDAARLTFEAAGFVIVAFPGCEDAAADVMEALLRSESDQ